MTKGVSITGRKVNDGIDFYETPIRCVDALLEREKFLGNILEPASGNGAISKRLIDNGYEVISKDIRTDEIVFGQGGCNIFDENLLYSNIVTNPPYCVAKDFITKSLSITNGKVCMFLKLQFLESIDRYSFFKSTPLKKVYVFCKRPTLYPANTEEPKNKGTIAYARYVREHGYLGEPTIDWII